MIGERIGMGALAVEFLLGQLDGAAVAGGLLGFAVLFSLLALVGRACHLVRYSMMFFLFRWGGRWDGVSIIEFRVL